jgi:Flp pilus assembly pilin Flp
MIKHYSFRASFFSELTTNPYRVEPSGQSSSDRAMTFTTVRDLVALLFQGHDEESEGQGLVEYALIIFLVSIAAMSALSAFGIAIKERLYDVILAAWPA